MSARLPPFAGVVSAVESRHGGLPVAEATARLHRLAYMKQRLAIAAAAFLPSTPEWEAKCALALHGWLDAEHAAMLYARLAELREPSPGPADVPDEALAAAFDELLAAPDTATRLTGVYRVARPQLDAALDDYLHKTNLLCDQPSVRLLRIVAAEEHEIQQWGNHAVEAFGASPEIDDWRGHLTTAFRSLADLPARRFVAPYRFDVTPARDAR